MSPQSDHLQDLAEIRAMMERSSKFLSLSGLSGVLAGCYALGAAWVSANVFEFNPTSMAYTLNTEHEQGLVLTALATLVLAVLSAILLSWRKAQKKEEKIWNATTRRVVTNVSIPLIAGAVLSFSLLQNDLVGLIAPITMLFYGIALYTAGSYTYHDIKYLGIIQIVLGLLACWFVQWGVLLWAIGFGLMHIVYGATMHFKYER